MTHAPTAELVDAAARRGTAVLAFNVITMEHAEGILAGAAEAAQPVILQISENAIGYHDGNPAPLIAACAGLIAASPIRAALHLDHIRDRSLLAFADPASGVSSAMFDASELDDDENVALTREVVRQLHARGIWVEAELGAIGGKGGAHAPGVRTDPDEAADYVTRTGVDALAVAVGSTHAMTEKTAELDIDLIARIRSKVDAPLVLHGSSGVPVGGLRTAAIAGIAKINIGTALNVAFTGRLRETIAAAPDMTDPRRYLGPARAALAQSVERLLVDLAGAAVAR